jgi:octaprenyl-diphosphate synthase
MGPEFEEGLKKMTYSSSALSSKVGCYILDSGGKRLRPRLVILIANALGIPTKDIIPLAYTVELLHNASLLHDDIVDETTIRRSRPTANQVFGDKPALLSGDYMVASALELTLNLDNPKLGLNLIKTIKRMAAGELKELEYTKMFHDNMDVYLDIIYMKTASLFEFCSSAPGILANLPQLKLDALATYGISIGMAFQIVDDIINLYPNEEDNKDAFNDIAEGKTTLPLFYIFKEQPEMVTRLNLISDPEERQNLIVPYLSRDVLDKSRLEANSYCEKAIAAIEDLDMLTEELHNIPSIIMSPIEERLPNTRIDRAMAT